jgi:imidazolonepropionase-like amidohydrolase
MTRLLRHANLVDVSTGVIKEKVNVSIEGDTITEISSSESATGLKERKMMADLLAVSKNPLEDIAILRDVILVVKGGRTVKDL